MFCNLKVMCFVLYNIQLSIICANRIISDLPPSYEWHKIPGMYPVLLLSFLSLKPTFFYQPAYLTQQISVRLNFHSSNSFRYLADQILQRHYTSIKANSSFMRFSYFSSLGNKSAFIQLL